MKLIAAQRTITAQRFGSFVFVDPGIYVASLGSALVFHVQRASYAKPITISQIIRGSGGRTVTRHLPSSILSGFAGLRDFIVMRVTNAAGKLVAASRQTFCPNSFQPQRASPDSASSSPYPQECAALDPFQRGMVWGVARGWAVDQIQLDRKLRLGTYRLTETITRNYLGLLHITARDATATVTIKVVKAGVGAAAPARSGRPSSRRPAGQHAALAPAPSVPNLRHPPRSALPDLVPLPAWGISTSTQRTKQHVTDQLDFGATVWIGGKGPLDVEGFRSHGSRTMLAYQYFSRNGHVIGRARAGTMGFTDDNQWHFQQFAQYRLLDSGKKLVVRSHKEGFCIAPTDPVDLVLPRATWQPSFIGLGGQCGDPSALSVREMLPVGWGDTYFQFVPGESFNISTLPNGTYYIEIIANPLRVLHESNTGDDVSLRKVILSGPAGHRTVRVPAVHGIDPER